MLNQKLVDVSFHPVFKIILAPEMFAKGSFGTKLAKKFVFEKKMVNNFRRLFVAQDALPNGFFLIKMVFFDIVDSAFEFVFKFLDAKWTSHFYFGVILV